MEQQQKELISSFMDGEAIDYDELESSSSDESFHACWHRYHIVRDTMRGNLHTSCVTLDISNNVAQSLANEPVYNKKATYSETLNEQPLVRDIMQPKTRVLFLHQFKDIAVKLSQVGLAACVTLAIIAGVQVYQGSSTNSDTSVLNTVPVGVSVSPVGGIDQHEHPINVEQKESDNHKSPSEDKKDQKTEQHLMTNK